MMTKPGFYWKPCLFHFESFWSICMGLGMIRSWKHGLAESRCPFSIIEDHQEHIYISKSELGSTARNQDINKSKLPIIHWSKCGYVIPHLGSILPRPVLCLGMPDSGHLPPWARAPNSFPSNRNHRSKCHPSALCAVLAMEGLCQYAEHLAQRFEGCAWAPCLGQLPTTFLPLPSVGMKMICVEQMWGNTMPCWLMTSLRSMPPWSPAQRTVMQFYQFWLWQRSPLNLKMPRSHFWSVLFVMWTSVCSLTCVILNVWLSYQ